MNRRSGENDSSREPVKRGTFFLLVEGGASKMRQEKRKKQQQSLLICNASLRCSVLVLSVTTGSNFWNLILKGKERTHANLVLSSIYTCNNYDTAGFQHCEMSNKLLVIRGFRTTGVRLSLYRRVVISSVSYASAVS